MDCWFSLSLNGQEVAKVPFKIGGLVKKEDPVEQSWEEGTEKSKT